MKNVSSNPMADSVKFSVSKFSEDAPGIFVEPLESNYINGVDPIY
jgi:hypothetical protein